MLLDFMLKGREDLLIHGIRVVAQSTHLTILLSLTCERDISLGVHLMQVGRHLVESLGVKEDLIVLLRHH